jgi:hypothetical protein
MSIAKRRGLARARVAVARKLAVTRDELREIARTLVEAVVAPHVQPEEPSLTAQFTL